MKSSLGTFDSYWIHQLLVDEEKFVSVTFIDKAFNQVDAWSSDPEKLRAVAADLIKGAEYLERVDKSEPDWVDNPGTGEPPVPDDHDVEVMFEDGSTDRNKQPNLRAWATWQTSNDRLKITRYRDWTAWEEGK